MALRTPSLQNDSLVGINREIGSQYDTVKAVAENIDSVVAVGTSKTNIDAVAANIDGIATINSNMSQITSTIEHIDEIVAVGTSIANVTQVADALDDIGAVLVQVVPQLSEILLADDNAAIATAKAAEATGQADIATAKAAAAVVSANAASASAAAAAGSQTSAATKATDAAASATAAHNSEMAAAAILDEFDDRYLGSHSDNPTVDNDGQAILDGALYFNTTVNVLKVYDVGTTTWLTLPQATFAALLDVQLASLNTGDVLKWNGSKWVNTAQANLVAGNATKLATSRTISLSAGVTGSASFDGSENANIEVTLATVVDSGTGTFKKIATDDKGRVTGTQAVAQADITGLLGAGSISNTMLANVAVANLSGTNTGDETAATIKSKLGIATLSGSNTGDQTITLTGDVTGTGKGSFATTLANSGATAGTYNSVTVDAKGRVTGGTNPTTVGGYGITDAYTKSQVYTQAETNSIVAVKAPLASPTFTGTVTLPSTTSIGNVNATELGYLDGVTSNIQTQLNSLSNAIEQTTTPILGLIWNQTDDTYKRIGKNINYLTIDGFNEFSSWRSVTAERQNDSDTVSASPLTAWLDTSTNLPFSSMKRYVIDNTGAEVKAYNANSFTHADQTAITATQQIMVKIPQFNYIQAKIVDGGKTYHIYAVAKSSFTLDALSDLGFIAPVITVWNPTTGVSSGTVAGNVLSSALHPAFVDNAGAILTKRYYGAFNAVNGRSICGASVRPTASIALATARTQCQGFGTGFTQLDFFLESAKNILALIERGSNYFERGGTSLGNKWEGNSATYASQSSYDQDNGLTLPLLNKTGVILNGSNKTIANSYRGIENYHSALWRWVDGVSLSSNVVYLAKPKATFSDGTITTPYFSSGYTVPSGANASYIADFGAGSFIPVMLGGSSSTKVTDAAWTGSTALFVGGSLSNASSGGLLAWLSINPASAVDWSLVSRSGF